MWDSIALIRLKDNFGIFQPGPYFPMSLCAYDSWVQLVLNLQPEPRNELKR